MDWSYFWLLIGGNTLAIASAGYLIKLLLDSHFKKQERALTAAIATERDTLKAQLDKEHAALQLSFSKALSAFSARHNPWAQKQLEVFSELYSMLFETMRTVGKLKECHTDAEYKDALSQYQAADNRLSTYYFGKRLFFGEVESEAVSNLLSSFQNVVENYSIRPVGPVNREDIVEHQRQILFDNHHLRAAMIECREVFHGILSAIDSGEAKEKSKA